MKKHWYCVTIEIEHDVPGDADTEIVQLHLKDLENDLKESFGTMPKFFEGKVEVILDDVSDEEDKINDEVHSYEVEMEKKNNLR
jgi:hypothetical protein